MSVQKNTGSTPGAKPGDTGNAGSGLRLQRGVPVEVRDILIAMYQAGEPLALITAATGVPAQQIINCAKWRKVARPSSPKSWSPARVALLTERYLAGDAVASIAGAVSALPGLPVSEGGVRTMLIKLRIGRPPTVYEQIARAIGVSNRDALDAVLWARKRGIHTGGTPVEIAARIAAAVQVAA